MCNSLKDTLIKISKKILMKDIFNHARICFENTHLYSVDNENYTLTTNVFFYKKKEIKYFKIQYDKNLIDSLKEINETMFEAICKSNDVYFFKYKTLGQKTIDAI